LLEQRSLRALRTRGERCTSATQRLHSVWQIRLFAAHRIVEALSGDLLVHSPYHSCLRLRQAIAHLESRGNRAIMSNIERATAACEGLQGRLTALSPLAVLDRGYSLTFTSAGRLVRESSAVAIGESLMTRLARGTVTSTVSRIEDKI